MQIPEQSQTFRFHFSVGFTSTQSCLQQLLSQRVQTKAFTQEPTKLFLRQLNSFTFHLTTKRPETSAESGNALVRLALQVLIELSSKVSFSIQFRSSIQLLQRIKQLPQAIKRIYFRSCISFRRWISSNRCFKFLRQEFLTSCADNACLAQGPPCSNVELLAGFLVKARHPPSHLTLEGSPFPGIAVPGRNPKPSTGSFLRILCHTGD